MHHLYQEKYHWCLILFLISLITGLTTLVTLSLLNEPASVESVSSIDGTVGPVKSNLISSVVSDSLVPFIIALKI